MALPVLLLMFVLILSVGLFFLKVGAVLYGTGFVLLAYLESGPVSAYGWLTRQQALDAVAAGQITPGPLIGTANSLLMVWPTTPHVCSSYIRRSSTLSRRCEVPTSLIASLSAVSGGGSGAANPSISGGSGLENQYVADGVNITDGAYVKNP